MDFQTLLTRMIMYRDTSEKLIKYFCEIDSNNNEEKTIEVRQLGNKLYCLKDNKKDTNANILACYTLSVLLAKNDTEDKALAFSNRSIILMNLKKYQESISDILKARENTKSIDLLEKLRAREIKCVSLMAAKVDGLNEHFVKLNLQPMITSITIPCASKFVSLKFRKKYGRHLVANQDIVPGTIISIEDGFSFPFKHKVLFNCFHCLNNTWNVVQCHNCISLYCSEKCKTDAWSSYHDQECCVFNNMMSLLDKFEDLTPAYVVAQRIFLKFVKEDGLEEILEQACEMDRNDDGQNFDKFFDDGLFQSNKFESFYGLSTSRNLCSDFPIEKLVDQLIIKTEILNNYAYDDKVKKSIGKIIKKLTAVVKNNASSYDNIMENGWIFTDDPKYFSSKTFYNIGTIVAPFSSLMNHSCEPNVVKIFANNQIISFAVKFIGKGEQLFVSYGPYVDWTLKNRVKFLLDNYDFKCNCKLCKKKWSFEEKKALKHMKDIHETSIKYTVLGFSGTFQNLDKLNYTNGGMMPHHDYPLNEKNFNDVKKMLRISQESSDCFIALCLIRIRLIRYVSMYVGEVYGVKVDMPGDF